MCSQKRPVYLNNSLAFSPKDLCACDTFMGTDINGLRGCDEHVKKHVIFHKEFYGLKW